MCVAETKRTQLLVLRERSRQPFSKCRARIGEILKQSQPLLRFGGEVFQFYRVIQRRADCPKSREQSCCRKAPAKRPTEDERDEQEAGEQRKGLISDIILSIGTKQGGHQRR